MKKYSKKQKFKSGLAVLIVVAFTGLVLVARYGDENLTESLIRFGRETEAVFLTGEGETVRSDSRFISRYGNRFYHAVFTLMLMYGLYGLLFTNSIKKRRYLRIALIYIFVQIIASVIITQGIKMTVGRPRPKESFSIRSEGEIPQRKPFSWRTTYMSFPSGHSADAFSSAGVIWMFSPSPVITAASFTFSGLIAFSRITAERHFVLDVIFGIIIGFATALILMYKKYNEDGS